MARRKKARRDQAPSLDDLVSDALKLIKTARKNRCNLSGDNFYANKLAALRADATAAFRPLASQSPGDTSALAELIEQVFSANTEQKKRIQSARELTFALRTTWKKASAAQQPERILDVIIPPSLLLATDRAYMSSIGRQINGCFSSQWLDACAVMLRRLLENCIIEAFEARSIAQKIKDSNGDYLKLTDLVNAALKETAWSLSRNTKKYLPQLKDLGHMSAHGRYFTARPEDIERVRGQARVVIEEFLHLANLIKAT